MVNLFLGADGTGNDQKGIGIVQFSMNDANVYNNFNNFEVPPYGVFCDIRIGKKSSLVAVHSFQDVLKKFENENNKKTIDTNISGTDFNATTKEGGNK